MEDEELREELAGGTEWEGKQIKKQRLRVDKEGKEYETKIES